MNRQLSVPALILAAGLLLGLAGLGSLLGEAAIQFKEYERTVTVKGLSEREVPADVVIWPIVFTEANNDLEALYQAIDASKQRKRLGDFGLVDRLATSAVTLVDPVPYIEFMNLVSGAAAVVTDSGGLQEETTYLGIPCLTLRENTERPITVTEGTNRLVRREELVARVREAAQGRWPAGRKPDLWDGRTAGRCVEALRRRAGV